MNCLWQKWNYYLKVFLLCWLNLLMAHSIKNYFSTFMPSTFSGHTKQLVQLSGTALRLLFYVSCDDSSIQNTTMKKKKKSHIKIPLFMQSYTKSSELLLLFLTSNMRRPTTSAGESNCSHWILLLVLYIREDGSETLFFWQNVLFWMPK